MRVTMAEKLYLLMEEQNFLELCENMNTHINNLLTVLTFFSYFGICECLLVKVLCAYGYNAKSAPMTAWSIAFRKSQFEKKATYDLC